MQKVKLRELCTVARNFLIGEKSLKLWSKKQTKTLLGLKFLNGAACVAYYSWTEEL